MMGLAVVVVKGGDMSRPANVQKLMDRLVASLRRRPFLCLGMMFYWLWTNITFQVPIIYKQNFVLPITGTFSLPSQIGPLCANILSYAALVCMFRVRRDERVPRHHLWLVCCALAAGSLLMTVWSESPVGAAGLSRTLFSAFYAVGSVLIGLGSSWLCIEMQRVYGSIESENILFHGSVSYLGSILIVFAMTFLPTIVTYCVYVLCPLPIARCLTIAHGELTQRELYARGVGMTFRVPHKLLVTSLLHGLSLGLLAGTSVYQSGVDTLLVIAVISYAISSILILITSFIMKLSFNNLIYQLAFPLIAIGLYASFALSSAPLVGVAIELVGFSFLHLVMWCVCSFLIKSFDLPSIWVVGTSTCLFMAGQLLGSLTGCVSAQLGDGDALYQRVIVTAMLVMLSASLLMVSNKNLRTGWGLCKPDATGVDRADGLDVVVGQLSATFSLTPREADVLRLLSRGRNRRAISEELGVSMETVKTHTQGVYRKLGIHSQQELLDVIDERIVQVQDD